MPTATPDKAADELDRRVREQGFKGALINGHSRGRYLDDKFFSPILERAEALNAPIYLHPTLPPKAVAEAYFAGFSPPVAGLLRAPAGAGTSRRRCIVLRMVLGGVFDRYPKLQIVIGHLGEGMPFMLPRRNKNFPTEMTKLERPIGAYLRENMHYTFGGFNFPATFQNLLAEVGVERIMFSADHPWGSMAEARKFLTRCRSARPTGSASPTAMRKSCSVCKGNRALRSNASKRMRPPSSAASCALPEISARRDRPEPHAFPASRPDAADAVITIAAAVSAASVSAEIANHSVVKSEIRHGDGPASLFQTTSFVVFAVVRGASRFDEHSARN